VQAGLCSNLMGGKAARRRWDQLAPARRACVNVEGWRQDAPVAVAEARDAATLEVVRDGDVAFGISPAAFPFPLWIGQPNWIHRTVATGSTSERRLSGWPRVQEIARRKALL